MTAMLGLPARTAERVPTYIIDARLALAPGGLILALQLARTVPVWLTRQFWALVDGAYFYRSYPAELLPEQTNGEVAAGIVDTLIFWHTAWLNGTLNGVFFWIGDARRESAVPINWNSDIILRYEHLSESFPAIAAGVQETASDPLVTCGQEALALAAALVMDAPVILTTAGDDRYAPPRLCSEAAEAARLEIHGPPGWSDGLRWADRIVPDDVRPLVSQLAHLGTRIAAVHALVPGALSASAPPKFDEAVDANRVGLQPDRWPWTRAHLFWHELS